MTALGHREVAPGNDADLVQRVIEGDERAFETVMRVHNRLLYRLARSILNDDSDAEDAVQETYLAAYRNLAQFRGQARLSTWLARIAINEAYARLRKRKRTGVVVPLNSSAQSGDRLESDPHERTMAHDTTEGPEAAASRAEVRQLLERCIDALPEQFRTAFILRDVEELSVEEAAECLNLTAATVRTRAFRARALLRASLSREIDAATVDAFGFAGERCDRIVSTVLHRLRSTRSRDASPAPESPA